MKRTVFLLLAAFAVVGLAASCGGGGDDDEYNFNGRWAMIGTVTTSNVPGVPPGSQYVDVFIIVQEGNNLRVTIQSIGSELIMAGPCDPEAKNFTASGVGTGSIAGSAGKVDGTGIDDESMSGALRLDFPGGFYTLMNWTADLSSRVAQKAGAGGNMKDVILKALR